MSIFYKAQAVADLLGVDLAQTDALANAGKLATKSVNGDSLVAADSLVDLAGDSNFGLLKSALVPFIKKQGLGMGSSFPISAVAQLLGNNNSGVSDLIGNGLLSGVMQGGEQMVSGNSLFGLLNGDQDKYGSILSKLGKFALQQVGFGKAGKFAIPAVASLLGLGGSDVQGLLNNGMLSPKMVDGEQYVDAGSLSRYVSGEPKYADVQDDLGDFAFSQLGFDVPEGILSKFGVGKVGAGLAGAAAAVGAGALKLKDKVDVPNIDLPNIGKPDVPDVNVPDVNMPNVDLDVPDVSVPDVNVPNVQAPDVDWSVPDVNVPDVNMPNVDVNVPDVNMPEMSVPDVNVPDINRPDMSMPDIEVDRLKTDMPDIDLPKVRQPDLDVDTGMPKWLLPVLLLALIAFGALMALRSCGGDEVEEAGEGAGTVVEEADGPIVCQVTDAGGIDDKSFNATAWRGVEEAAEEFNGEAKYLESQQQTDYERNISAFLDDGCDLIVTVGFLLREATQSAAEENPDQKFAIVDASYDPGYDNVLGLEYNVNEAAFLAGYVAADQTETGIVGTFGGINIPPVTGFMDGFVLGVDHYNEMNGTDVEAIGWNVDDQDGLFAGNFDSTDDGRTLGESLMDEGADIVMPVAGPVGLGTAEAARDRGTKIVGVDTDWTDSTEYEDVVLTSVLKRMDTTVFGASELVANDEFVGGTFFGNLENNGVGIVTDGLDGDLVDALDEIKGQIIDGDLIASP